MVKLTQLTPEQRDGLLAVNCARPHTVNTRTLRSLERAGLVTQDSYGWRLTDAGSRRITEP